MTREPQIRKGPFISDTVSRGAIAGIAIAVFVIVMILPVVVFLMALRCWVKESRHTKHRLSSSAEAIELEPANEMVYKYTRLEHKESTTQIQETVNVGLEEAEYYTPMSPTTPIAPQIRSQSLEHGPTIKVEEKFKKVCGSMAAQLQGQPDVGYPHTLIELQVHTQEGAEHGNK